MLAGNWYVLSPNAFSRTDIDCMMLLYLLEARTQHFFQGSLCLKKIVSTGQSQFIIPGCLKFEMVLRCFAGLHTRRGFGSDLRSCSCSFSICRSMAGRMRCDAFTARWICLEMGYTEYPVLWHFLKWGTCAECVPEPGCAVLQVGVSRMSDDMGRQRL